MFDRVNLEKALKDMREERKNNVEGEAVLSEFKSLFEADWEREQRVHDTVQAGAVSSDLLPAKNLEEERIFELEEIKKLCQTYRLRFLSTRYFKNEIPREGILRIKSTEERAGAEIKSFMIAAPASLFKLQDVNKDPLLFAPLSDGSFYLIHKWGGDVSALRRMMCSPLKTPAHLLATVIGLSVLLSAVVPTTMLAGADAAYFNFYRFAFLAWNIVFLSGMVSYFWFASNMKFSAHAWNDKHFN